ncbi:APC family permease [Agromyces sp. Marseille-Q5079]|uniref:APC family permease n=1 Tax=Agromyces sp. Marseille-Q5079 TaxID=3439059 RepID=UPI003D9C9D2E
MSALSDAIARRMPDSSLGQVSPLHGLRRGSVTTLDLVAQSVAAVAPAGGLLILTGGLVDRTGSFAFVTLLLTAAAVILVALSMSVFARRISAAGGIYTFVTRGLGPVAGMIAGVALLLGYAGVSMDTLRSAVRRLGVAFGDDGQWASGSVATVVLVVGIGAAITAIIGLGAKTSTRVMLVVEAVVVTALVGLSVAVLASTGWKAPDVLPDLAAAPSLSSFAEGIGFALICFVGFESGAALGPESRRPLATVPRALVWTIAAVAAVYLFGMLAQLSAVADGRDAALLTDADLVASPWLGSLIEAVVAASWIACTLACTNALVRLVFTMAREGVLPTALGRTSARFATPHVAALAVGTVIIAGTLLLVWAGRESLYRDVVHLSQSMAFIIAYLAVCAAAVPYLVRIGEFSLREAWPAVLGTLALAGVAGTEVLAEASEDPTALCVLLAVIAVATLAHLLRVRSGSVLAARVGAYDTPVASDAISSPVAPPPRS